MLLSKLIIQIQKKTCLVCILLLVLSLSSFKTNAQTIQSSCVNHFVGNSCSFTIYPIDGDDVQYYRLEGFPQAVSVSTNRGNNTKTYTTTWQYTGTYTLNLRAEPDGPYIYSITVEVHRQVGPVSISGPSLVCQSTTTTAFSASASNASYYSWEMYPAAAGSIRSSDGFVNWNSGFTGNATIEVSAYGTFGDFKTSQLIVNRQATGYFSASLNAPSVVCEGQAFTISASSNYAAASYNWYQDDSNQVIGTTSSLSVTPQLNSTFRAVITPSASAPCLASYSPVTVNTTLASFYVKPRVNGLHFTAGPTSVCTTPGATSQYSALAYSAESYQWSLTPTAAGSISASGLVSWNSTFNGTATVRVTSNGCGGSQQVLDANIWVRPIPTASVSLASQERCSGEQMTLVAIGNPNNVSGTSLSWTVSAPNITGATAGSGTFIQQTLLNATTASQTAVYTITPTANGCTGSSVTHTVIVKPVPLLNSALFPSPVCNSSDVVNVSYTPSSTIPGSTFSWSRTSVSGIVQPGTGSAGGISEILTNTNSYQTPVTYRYVTSYNGCGSVQNVTIGIYPPVTSGGLGSISAICIGSSPGTLPVSSSAGGNGSYTYQWEQSLNGSTWQNAVGSSTSAQYTPPVLYSSTYYRRKVSSCNASVYTNSSLTTVTPASVGGLVSSNMEAFVSASGSLVLSEYIGTIQKWQQKVGSGAWTDVANTSANYTYTDVHATTYFRGIVRSGTCSEVASSEVAVVILPAPIISIDGPQAIAPASSTSVSVLAGFYGYQWYRNNELMPGATANTLTITKPGEYAVVIQLNSASTPFGTEPVEIDNSLDEDQNLNYLRTVAYTLAGMNGDEDLFNLSPSEYMISTSYVDELGRPMQSVSLGGSGKGKDLVQAIVYDELGRESKKYLPYATDLRDGRYQLTAVEDQALFYAGVDPTVAQDASPFSQSIFEASPLNRPIKQGAPGDAWQPDLNNTYSSIDHTIKKAYEFNVASEVLRWTFANPMEEYSTTAVNAFGKVNAGTTAAPVYYAANQLFKNKTKDEQENQVIEYVDKEGRTILKRVQAVVGNPSTADNLRHTNWASTYYIYDDFGNLVCVIPPEASNRLATQYFQSGSTDASKNAFLKRWAFRYRYDQRKRMTMKQVPGAEPVFMVYDNRDRLVMTQDGNQRSSKRWTFTKYDALNRQVLTGIYTSDSVLQLNKMQRRVNVFYAAVPGNGGAWFESFNVNNTLHGYDNKSYPPESNTANYLTVNYYDTYDVRNTWTGEYAYINEGLTQTVEEETYTQPTTILTAVVGLQTASKIKVLDGGVTGGHTWLHSVSYYDDKYKVVQTISDNYRGGIDRTTNLYDFVGKILQSKTSHATADIQWTDFVSTFSDGNKLISGNEFVQAWGNAGAASVQKIGAGQDAWMEFTIFQTWGNTMMGLSDQNVDANFTSIDYAFYATGGSVLRIYENGVNKFAVPGGYALGDRLKISRTGSVIKYYRNNVLVYTSLTPSLSVLLVDASFYNRNLSVFNVRSSFSQGNSTTYRSYGYDQAGRLINTWHSFNGATPVLLVHNEYNELGQLIDKDLHSTIADASDAQQSVDYRYNIRGWLTSINNAELTSDNSNDDANDYFGMQLAYNTDLGTGNVGHLQYNGNISATKWSNLYGQSSIKENAYNYTYDAMNRLKTADFRQQVGGTWGLAQYRATNGSMQAVNAFSENIGNYDLNGNILSLRRSGQDGQLIDDLTYNYGAATSSQSNKLLRVTDVSDDLKGFVEINSSIDDYTYDNNGNLLYDRNKSSEELIKNGTFDSAGSEWIVDVPARVNFVNSRAEIAAGTGAVMLSQPVLLKNSMPHVVNLTIVRTTGSGTINVKVGSSSANYSLSATTSISVVAGTTDDFKIIVSADFVGYIEEVSAHATTAITYNLLNLPETVTQGEKGTIRYIYTTTGQKLAQVVTQGTNTKTTDYVGEYIYQNDTLQFIQHEEGRIIPSPLSPGEGAGGEAEYQYHLKDHLGNVRLTFTTQQEVEVVAATLETTEEGDERAAFLKYDDIRKVNSPLFDHTTTGTTQYAMRLTGTPAETYGLARSIAVMPGDKIKTEVYAKYLDTNTANWTAALTDLMAAIASGGTAPGTVVDGGTYGSATASSIPFASPVGKSSEPSDIPKAYLNWLVFDKNFVPIANKSGFRRISAAAMESGVLAPEGVPHEKLESPLIEINEPGYVYIYLSNEELGKEVYFDDFKVTHTKSPVIQSDDYYPFGLTFNSYKRENSLKNKMLFQGQEHIDDLDLGWGSFKWRNHMSDIGRFFNVDPLADKYVHNSPYAFSENKVIAHIELEGLEAWDIKYSDGSTSQVYGPYSNQSAAEEYADNYLTVSPISSPKVVSEVDENRKHPVTGENRPHKGIDLHDSNGKTDGATVVAPLNGIVIDKGESETFGNYVNIKSNRDGKVHKLNHMQDGSTDKVEKNVEVKRGDIIGKVGSTGLSSGPHMHYEVRGGKTGYGKVYDPLVEVPAIQTPSESDKQVVKTQKSPIKHSWIYE